MKRTCKRLTALVLALAMCLSLLSVTAWAADVSWGGTLKNPL